ncbi:T3SS (YopN, CesT) and YbjN peptide-binding chaperone 1 [Prescottella subtropica]|uniref:T3SS (YopN, CesT) and YbjN peptide-binding chaperone 1 n=1 Tax=Prescottella subtropica TaxID=2545757 RepID=UPI0010FA54AE|nr:YbjN domain-containing protein [Prescottella subtropica]
MSEFSNRFAGGDFDRTIGDAWGTCRVRLADRIASATVDDQVIVETVCETDDADGRMPFVQCHIIDGPDGPLVRCGIPTDLHLPPWRRLSDTDCARLHAQGWTQPADDDTAAEFSFVVEKSPRWADQLASMILSVFRETWAVPHPSFLSSQHLGEDGATDPDAAASTPTPTPLDRYVAIRPRDTDHLRQVIAHTLTDMYGQEPERDADGDIVLRFGSALALVIANEAAPEIQLWAPLVRDIAGRTRASELIGDLNRRWPHLRFALYEDRLRVMIDLLADPFVPQHLADLVEHLGEFLGGVDEEFASHFGGYLHFPPAPDTAEGAAPAPAPAVTPAVQASDTPIAEPPRPVQEPIQPSLFDDLED